MNEMSKDLGRRLAEIKGAEVIKSFCYTCPWQCPTEVFVRDEAGNVTKISPHNEKGNWEYYSKNIKTVIHPRRKYNIFSIWGEARGRIKHSHIANPFNVLLHSSRLHSGREIATGHPIIKSWFTSYVYEFDSQSGIV